MRRRVKTFYKPYYQKMYDLDDEINEYAEDHNLFPVSISLAQNKGGSNPDGDIYATVIFEESEVWL